jgi:ribosomal protein S27E
MTGVISLTKAREERQPHIAGVFVCVGCRHEWIGIAPLGVRWHECPACSLPKATVKHPFAADEGDLELRCVECGGETLTAYKRNGKFWVRCMGCGNDLTHAFYDG